VEEVVLVFDHPGCEAVGEQVSEPPVAFVELLCVAAVQEAESPRERVPRGVEDEVVVGGHEAEGVDRPVEPLDASPEMREELAAVGVVSEDRAAVDAARDRVEVPVGEQHAWQARHDVDET
jgi:hypothetical protein